MNIISKESYKGVIVGDRIITKLLELSFIIDLFTQWDALQMFAQTGPSNKEAPDTRVEEYLTPAFKTALKVTNMDRSSRIDENVQDLDSLVKEEANTKVVGSYLIDFSSIYLDESDCQVLYCW